MEIESNSYEKYIIRSILATNQFGITEVKKLKSLKSKPFLKEEYSVIENFIKLGDIDAIKYFSGNQISTGEYLDIVLFSDEHGKKYIATIYDSDLLEQDPQVIEIYSL